MPSWVWAIESKDNRHKVVLSEVPTRYEALSGIVGTLFNWCIPGTYPILNRAIFWLDKKTVPKYEIGIPEDIYKFLSDFEEESYESEETTEGTKAQAD
jgi:hypothetical protein